MDRRLVWVAQSVDVLPFVHTPLHEASTFGKTDLAMELMILMPSFASKLNTHGFSPLHLAVENHQVEVALELVKFNPDLIRLRGREGVTPLHLAAEKGDVDLLTEFLIACPKSILDVNVNGETALHIAVLNGRYEELKLLTGWIQRMTQTGAAFSETEILNKQNRDGNTVLHVAASENKHQAVKTLLKCVSLDRNIQNKDGFTSLDILRTNGRYMDKETERLIQKSGGKSKAALSKVKKSSQTLRLPVTFWEFCSTTMIRYRKDISDGARNALLVLTTLIITATYQTALQPPSLNEEYGVPHFGIIYLVLWVFNTMAFMLASSMTLILLPIGREYIWCYLLILIPLSCSYWMAVYLNTLLTSLVFPALLVIAGILAILCYLLFLYVKWKRTLEMKTVKPKSEMVLEGFSTMV